MTKSQKKRIVALARYAILSAWAVIVAFPIYWMVSTSFKPSEQWFAWAYQLRPDRSRAEFLRHNYYYRWRKLLSPPGLRRRATFHGANG